MEVKMGKSAKKSKSTNKILGFVFLVLIVAALVLVIVGMCVDVLKVTTTVKNILGGGETEKVVSYNLFGEHWDSFNKLDISNTFLLISFIIAMVGCVALIVDCILRVFLKKNFKIFRALGAFITLVGAVLILVAGLVLAGNFNDLGGESGDAIKDFISNFGAESNWSAATGVWLGFVGGLVGAIAGGAQLAKALN